jgi:hypothetical protein
LVGRIASLQHLNEFRLRHVRVQRQFLEEFLSLLDLKLVANLLVRGVAHRRRIDVAIVRALLYQFPLYFVRDNWKVHLSHVKVLSVWAEKQLHCR